MEFTRLLTLCSIRMPPMPSTQAPEAFGEANGTVDMGIAQDVVNGIGETRVSERGIMVIQFMHRTSFSDQRLANGCLNILMEGKC